MSRTIVWLTRHAESADPSVFHGAESNIGLSALGHRQAQRAAEWYREREPTLVISSEMHRAVDTARPIAELCRVQHVREFALHERVIGELCGVRFSLTDGPWAETLKEWTSGNTRYTTPGAESFDDLRNRLVPVWNALTDRQRGERIVMVTHGVVCKILLLCLLPGWGATRWHELGRVANLAVSELVEEAGQWSGRTLLKVPEPVLALGSAGVPGRMKSEA